MTLGLHLYKFLTSILAPFAGAFFRSRVTSGKEFAGRLNERLARDLAERPSGRLVWCHAASVGESQLHLELIRRLAEQSGSAFSVLITCQTKTAAELIVSEFAEDPAFKAITCIQQMAPVDTPGSAKRFIQHWKPDLALFAEGEIWPNQLLLLKQASVPTALINARMTEESIKGWMRWRKTARKVFGCFDLMISADTQTKTGLETLSGTSVHNPGNLKSSLPAPTVDMNELAQIKRLVDGRPILLAASTHAGEEALILDAFMQVSNAPFLIIAPRHPERGDEVDALLSCTRFGVARRSEGDPITSETDILLADTMGEMGLWYRLAHTVYVGGGHAPGVGGHNPLEALRLNKPVLTGPSLFNFQDLALRLQKHTGFTVVDDAAALAAAFPAQAVSAELREMLETDAIGPMARTLDLLVPMRQQAGLLS